MLCLIFFVDAWCGGGVLFNKDKTTLIAYPSATGGISIPDGVTSIGEGAFWGCSSLTSISIPSSVTSIGDEAFSYCDSLTRVSIPSFVTSIGDWAFSGCYSLTWINIPTSVTSIGEGAFLGCSSLAIVRVETKTPPTLGIDAFEDSLDKIQVPSGVVNNCKRAYGWEDYASKIVGY